MSQPAAPSGRPSTGKYCKYLPNPDALLKASSFGESSAETVCDAMLTKHNPHKNGTVLDRREQQMSK